MKHIFCFLISFFILSSCAFYNVECKDCTFKVDTIKIFHKKQKDKKGKVEFLVNKPVIEKENYKIFEIKGE